MIPSRRAVVLFASLLTAAALHGQPVVDPAPFGDDERTARVAERYEAMLDANPVEGMALDRLWKAFEERNATAALIEGYHRAADNTQKPAATLVYGHLLKRAGRLDDAATAYERAAKADPTNPLPLIAQAELATVRAHPAEAAALFEQALAKVPATDRRRADWLLKLGDAWLAAGQPLKASEAWEKLVAADPANLALRKQLAVNYEKNGLPDRAIIHYEYIDQHADPAGRAAALRELGRLHEVRGDFDAARDALERGLALTARDNWLYGELQSQIIRLYQRAGKAPELEARWQAAVAQTPRDLGAYTRLIALAEAQGDPVAERTWLEKLVALVPRDREYTFKLARLLSDAGETQRAAALYDALLKIQPGNLDLIFARADLDLRANRTDEAVRRIEERLAQNPADESVSVPSLQFFLAHRLDVAAEKCLRAAVARQPLATEPTVALAKFYLTRRLSDKALETLESFTRQSGEPAAKSARWAAAAECYSEAKEPGEALRCWNEALALQPMSPAALSAVGELLLAKGDFEAGSEQMERALAATPEGPARDELDHKFFQALTDRPANAESLGDAPAGRRAATFVTDAKGRVLVIGPGFSSLSLSPKKLPTGPGETGRFLAQYFDQLDKTVREKPTATGYLRLARWSQWTHRPREANLAAEALLKLVPDSIPAREILAESAIATHRRADAIARLREIAALDPVRKSVALGRVADLLLEDGDYDGALAVLDALVQDEPGSVDALTDLALGQQRADRWFDALATWEHAYALPRLTPSQRANLRRPLLAAHEHLGHFQRAAELLQAALEVQDDLATRRDLFHELVNFCQSHSLTPWLREVYQRRLAAQPQDYFAMTAMAELHKAAGESREAYDLLAKAYYSAPEPAAALRSLVEEAEALGETADAVAHQRRLVALAGQANPETLAKLAALEEADLDDEAASRTYEQIAVRFPRDTSALGSASDYFFKTRQTGRARELLARAVALDPGDFRRVFQLGQLNLQAGDRVGARVCFEGILDRTSPEKPTDPLRVPQGLDPSADPSVFIAATGRGAARGRYDPTPTGEMAADKDERGIRLKAIGELSSLFFSTNDDASSDDRRRWLERWRTAAASGLRSEPLTAFFAAGQKDAAVELTASWLNSGDPDQREDAEGIFLLTGLRMKDYLPLARWTWDDGEGGGGRRPARLIEALQNFFATGGQPGPGMVADLFPEEMKSRVLLWQIASGVFADKHWYPQAVELGERALALSSGGSAAESYQLAQWEVDLGQPDDARRVLARAVEKSSGTAYDATANNAVFADLRAYYFLLPAGERSGFVADYLKRAKTRAGETVHATLAAALLHGLQGDAAEACRDLDRLVEMRLLDGRTGSEHWTPDMRRWNYLFACGAQLQAWNLDNLAAHLWKRGLANASAFDRQDQDVRNTLAEIRMRQFVAEVLTAADPLEANRRTEEFLREGPSVITLASAASALVSVGQHPTAIRLYQRLCRLMPAEGDYTRSLMFALDAVGDHAALERLLTGMLDGTLPSGNASNRFEITTRLATVRENSGDLEGAFRLLLDARRQQPHAIVLLKTLAGFLERRDRLDDAAAVLREVVQYDRGFSSVADLAFLEIRRGNLEAAFRLVREAKFAEGASEQSLSISQRICLYLVTSHSHEAIELAEQWVRDGHTDRVPEIASDLAAHGQHQAARDLLTGAMRTTREHQARYEMQRAFVKIFCAGDDVSMETFTRELRRLEHLAQTAPGLRAEYVYDRCTLATARGANEWLENELKQEWLEGRGDIAAGEGLAKLYFETKQWEPLRQLVAAVDARPNLPEQTLHSLASQLVETGHAALALRITERLYRRFPQNNEYVLLRARALWDSDHRQDAAGVLDAADAAGVFRETSGGQAATLWIALGERGRARASLEAVLARDPYAVRSAPTQIRLAALDLEERRADEACQRLTSAYRNPATADMAPLVNALAAAGRLEINSTGDLPGGDLPLVFLRRAQWFAAVCERLDHDGRSDDAFKLARAHPELLTEVPGFLQTLRRITPQDQALALTRLVEQAIAGSEFPAPLLMRELAKLLLLAAEGPHARPAEVTNLLTRAHELAPDDFAVSRRLAETFRSQGQSNRAAELLKTYLTAEALPSEREAARKVLGLK